MFHPAAALHQQSLRQTLIDDFKKLPAYIARARGAVTPPAPPAAPASPPPPDEPDEPKQLSFF
jgi:DNA polymerase